MAPKIKSPVIPLQNNKIPEPKIDTKKDKPVIGMSFLQITNNRFGLKELNDVAKRRKDRDVYRELETFVKCASKMASIESVIERYHSRYSSKNKDKESQKMITLLKKEYDIDATDLIHMHCKANGKGEFVLHGFIRRNVFEIVWIDPEHTLHSV